MLPRAGISHSVCPEQSVLFEASIVFSSAKNYHDCPTDKESKDGLNSPLGDILRSLSF